MVWVGFGVCVALWAFWCFWWGVVLSLFCDWEGSRVGNGLVVIVGFVTLCWKQCFIGVFL